MQEPFRMKDEAWRLDPISNPRDRYIGTSTPAPDFEEELRRELGRERVKNFTLRQRNRELTDDALRGKGCSQGGQYAEGV